MSGQQTGIPIPMNEHLYQVMYAYMRKQDGIVPVDIPNYIVSVVDIATRKGMTQQQVYLELSILRDGLTEAINSIKPKTYVYSEGTPEQRAKIEELIADGYIWNQKDSIAAAGIVLDKGDDRWFIGLNGEILHNPHKRTKEDYLTNSAQERKIKELKEQGYDYNHNDPKGLWLEKGNDRWFFGTHGEIVHRPEKSFHEDIF